MRAEDSGWRGAYEAAQGAWPTVTLAFDRFVAHAAQVGFSAGAGDNDPDAALVADVFLACACGEGDGAAIEALEQQYIAPARFSLKRLDPRPEFIDDVM